jgi:hypothetical protein
VIRRVLVVLLLALVPRLLAGQANTTGIGPAVTFGAEPLTLTPPPALSHRWMGAPWQPTAASVATWDSALTVTLDSAREARATALRLGTIYRVRTRQQIDTVGVAESKGLLGVNKSYADLSVDGLDRFEARVERIQNQRCTASAALDLSSSCSGNGFRAPHLDNTLSIRASGLLARRLHLNVDYDAQRDLATSNDIQVYYEGLQDEVVRRIEVGTVSFRPPASRFLTAATPMNNFGVNATFEIGPVQLQGIVATQKGSTVAQRTYTIGQTTTQPQDRQVRDLEFEPGRFFWVINPLLVPGYPASDILNLQTVAIPAPARPVSVHVYRYRPTTGKGVTNPNLGGITAVARRPDSDQRVGPLPSAWQLLVPGQDYYLDDSGLWFMLSNKIDLSDYLAVSYITATGDTVGSFPETDNPARSDSLELIVQPRVPATEPTFRYEMRQVYRIAGSDLDRSTLRLGITVNRSERPIKPGQATYLAQLGLAVPTDANLFDVDNRVFPRVHDPVPEQVTKDAFVVFPNARPFADTALLAPQELQDSLYTTPLYALFTEGPAAKFLLRMQYNSTGAGDQATLDLNALQISEGTEVLMVNGRTLVRGVDYTVAYDLGQVTFLNPSVLFGGQPAVVTARFEERGLFAVAPTQLYGMALRYSLGERGSVNLVGVYQAEQSAFNRPALGFEATANLVGGGNVDLHFKPALFTRFLNAITGAPATAPSQLDLNGEVAFTKPNANRAGQAYVEDFESEDGLQITLRESGWEYGSVPQSAAGVEGIVGAVFDSSDAVQLTWQNLVPNGQGGVVQLRPQDIDPLVQTVGGQTIYETVLFTTLQADTAGGIVQTSGHSRWSLPERPDRPRWRSLVTSLSPTGIDLTRTEFLQFWVYQGATHPLDSAGAELVIDLGDVNEDALALAPDSVSADSVFTGRQYTGVGQLDTERDSLTQVWNAGTDDNGILGDRPDSLFGPSGAPTYRPALCQTSLSNTVLVYPWGDLGSRCTNGNGFPDTEDLNGDGVLNATGPNENVYRWVVNPADLKYFVRDGVTAPDSLAGWKLYQVPIRIPDEVVGSPDIRLIRNVRVTMVAPAMGLQPDIVARFALARMRFVSSPWFRRSDRPVASLAGTLEEPNGAVAVSTVSTTDGQIAYTSPPGVVGEVDRKGTNTGSIGVQVNEHSLQILAQGLGYHQRAEAYNRLVGGAQNLLKYSQMQVWTRGYGDGWNEGDFQAYIRVGTDEQNFYQYMAPASSTTWDPEMVVDLQTWVQLRTQLEVRYLEGQPADSALRVSCGGDTVSTAYVNCSGGYLVYLSDPGIRPPNLAAVQEFSAGIYRVASNSAVTDAELWVDDIRMSSPVNKTGSAVALDARLVGSDVLEASASLIDQNGYFQQIGQTPTYRTTQQFQVGGTLRLDRFLPGKLGISMPLTIAYGSTSINPILFTGSDVAASAVTGLRKPSGSTETYSVALRRSVRSASWAMRAFVDPWTASATLSRGATQNEYSSLNANAYNYQFSYSAALTRASIPLGLGGVVSGLPGFIRQGELGKGLSGSGFAYIPTSIRFSSGVTHTAGAQTTFQSPVAQPSDTALVPVQSLIYTWRNAGGITWQPLGMLVLGGDLSSTRDLRNYPDSTSLGRVVSASRQTFLGIDAGVERDRTVTTTISIVPRLSSWLRPRYTTTSNFLLLRSLTSRPLVQADGDSGAFILPQSLNNQRGRELGFGVDLARLVANLAGEKSKGAVLLKGLRQIDLSWRSTTGSLFDLAAFSPDLSYMLALGGLNNFLYHQGDSALSALKTSNATIGAGAALPLGLSFNLAYARIQADRYQQFSNGYLVTSSDQTEWPSGNVRITRNFRGGPLALVGLGANFRKREGTTTQQGTGGSTTATKSSTFGPDLQFGFRNGMAFVVRYLSNHQENSAFGNVTQSDQSSINGAFNYTIRLPASLSSKRRTLRTSVTGQLSTSTNCLQSRDQADCRVLSDIRRSEFQAGFDTELMRILTGGFQAGYVLDDARSLDRKVSQLFFAINFTLSLYAGDYR